MDYDVRHHVPNLKRKLKFFRILPAEHILELASNVFSGYNDSRLPEEYLRSLNYSDQILCFRACIICWSKASRVLEHIEASQTVGRCKTEERSRVDTFLCQISKFSRRRIRYWKHKRLEKANRWWPPSKISIIRTLSAIQTQIYRSSYRGFSPPSYEDRSPVYLMEWLWLNIMRPAVRTHSV